MHTADDTPSSDAATRSKHCNFTCQGDIRPRAAAGSTRIGQHKPWQQQWEHDWSEKKHRRQQHRLRVVLPRTHSEEVIPEKGKCYRAVQARDTLAFQQQILNVAPSVFPSRSALGAETKSGHERKT